MSYYFKLHWMLACKKKIELIWIFVPDFNSRSWSRYTSIEIQILNSIRNIHWQKIYIAYLFNFTYFRMPELKFRSWSNFKKFLHWYAKWRENINKLRNLQIICVIFVFSGNAELVIKLIFFMVWSKSIEQRP